MSGRWRQTRGWRIGRGILMVIGYVVGVLCYAVGVWLTALSVVGFALTGGLLVLMPVSRGKRKEEPWYVGFKV
jgi:hypothetical protein